MATSPHPAPDATDSVFSAERYFATQLPPPSLEHDVERVREFVQRHKEANRKVVLVTVNCTAQCPIGCADGLSLEWRHDCASRAQCVSTLGTVFSADAELISVRL